jgi:NAD(P)-dependent dehydrogenase (short-subunit alcohol dehydrogenase family)
MRRTGYVAAAAGAALGARAAVQRAREIDLAGRVALVTGASRGLGFALAQELASHGARLVICARGAEQLERAREKLAARGADVVAHTCDVSVREQVDALVDQHERIDVLINNAGVIQVGPLSTQTHEDFEEAIATMVWGTINPTLAVLPGMIERGDGRIANITSIGGKLAVPWLVPYATAKFAAVGFSQGLRAELAGTGVRVTTVVPGLMRTGSFLAAYFKGDRADLEYSLFTPLSSLPGATISGERAARRIVAAIRRGEPEVTLTLLAVAAARANGAAPGLVADALGFVGRLLPGVRGTQRVRGSDIASPVDHSPLTALGRRAAQRLNQLS